jgi:hypothetical protein
LAGIVQLLFRKLANYAIIMLHKQLDRLLVDGQKSNRSAVSSQSQYEEVQMSPKENAHESESAAASGETSDGQVRIKSRDGRVMINSRLYRD